MVVRFCNNVNTECFRSSFAELSAIPQVNTILVILADSHYDQMETISGIVRDSELPVAGALFPQIIYQGKNYDQGMIMIGITGASHLVKLTENQFHIDNLEQQLGGDLGPFKTVLIMLDGFANAINTLIDSLYNVLGLDYNYIGGGAGSLTLQQRPCLFTRSNFFQNGALLLFLDAESKIGVSHGWRELTGPFKVTESSGNVIKSLNGEPAFNVYSKIIAEQTGIQVTHQDFYDIAKNYPFGLSYLGKEHIVRDPFKVINEQSIVCFGEIPMGSFVNILHANTDDIIHAAQDAVEKGSADPDDIVVLIDCISRLLLLGNDFDRELRLVRNMNRNVIGALTLGEICNSGKAYIEFYNKSIVVGAIQDAG